MTRIRTLLAVLLVATAVTACTGHGLAATSESLVPREPGDLAGSTWVLIGTGETHAVPPSARFLLIFVDHAVTTAATCRSFRLAFTDSGDAIHGGGRSFFTLACPTRRAVSRYNVERLGRVDTAQLESGSLVLTGPHSVRLVFNPRNAKAHHVIDEL